MKTGAKVLIAFLLIVLLFLAVAAVRKKPEARPTTPFVPPGWVAPTSPPPFAK